MESKISWKRLPKINFFNKKYFSLLKNSEYIVIKEPEKEGTLLSKN
jgi:hypothetical protein